MELKTLYLLLKARIKPLLAISIFASFIGASLFFIVPPTYNATGTLYVASISNDITFSGETPLLYSESAGNYYAQQTALSYTETVIGLLESVDIRSTALNSLSVKADTTNLRKYGRLIKIKNPAPQLISLTTKGKTSKDAQTLWQALTTVTTQTTLNDPGLVVFKISETPVVQMTYRNIGLNTFAGFAFGFFVSSLGFAFKEYV